MSENGLRISVLHGVLMILAGMVLAGFPLTFHIVEQVYGQPMPMPVGGDARGWMMAHLEGLMNGLLVIALALATRIGGELKAGRERWLVPALLIAGWGNVVASILAPILGVRGMAFDNHAANNLVTGLFTVALVASFAAFYGVIAHLARRPGQS